MSKRQQIVNSLKAQLKTLESKNPFWQNVTFLEWENTIDSSTLPALIIFDKHDSIEQKSSEHQHHLHIEIELHTAGDDAKPEFIRERIPEILEVLRDESEECDYIDLKSIDLNIESAENRAAQVQIITEVQYFNGFWKD